MWVQLWLLVFGVIGVQRGLCLKCYSCLSTGPRDACVRFDKNKIPLKHCDTRELEQTERYAKEIDIEMGKFYEVHAAQEPLLPLNCLKQVIRHGEKHYTLRGCQLGTGDKLDICVKVTKENNELLSTDHCKMCNSDGCNAASAKTWSLVGTIGASIAALLLKYCL